jgi:hypothetical protein
MLKRNELPTVPPPFNIDRFAQDSEARIRARDAAPLSEPAPASSSFRTDPAPLATGDAEADDPKSERRLATRSNPESATPEAWARSMTGLPRLAVPFDLLKAMPLDHRAGYVLSLMDGSIDLETMADISTIPRDEVLRIVRYLYEGGIVEFR